VSALLEVSHLAANIQAMPALRDLSLEVGEGEMVSLVGRNGAGKTSFMRAVMGHLPATGGSLHFAGADLRPLPRHARAGLGIGYMPEDRGLVPQLTVEENILLPAWATGRADTAKRLATVYELVPEAREFAQRRGLQLSGGQQKLAALARALMCGTRLLLLDEPFEGVAPVLAQRLVEVIGRLKREGLSVILSESDLAHSSDMLDTVHLIDRGAVTRGRLEQVQ
jgi:branched-chain amino acid transport system ATP-binding protein